MNYQIKKIKRDGRIIVKFKCPKCNEWADIDNDQYNGRVSIWHDTLECGFHETINLKEILKTK